MGSPSQFGGLIKWGLPPAPEGTFAAEKKKQEEAAAQAALAQMEARKAAAYAQAEQAAQAAGVPTFEWEGRTRYTRIPTASVPASSPSATPTTSAPPPNPLGAPEWKGVPHPAPPELWQPGGMGKPAFVPGAMEDKLGQPAYPGISMTVGGGPEGMSKLRQEAQDWMLQGKKDRALQAGVEASRDPMQQVWENEFLSGRYNQNMMDDLTRAKWEQQMQGAGINPQERETAEVANVAAEAGLKGKQGELAGAQAEVVGQSAEEDAKRQSIMPLVGLIKNDPGWQARLPMKTAEVFGAKQAAGMFRGLKFVQLPPDIRASIQEEAWVAMAAEASMALRVANARNSFGS